MLLVFYGETLSQANISFVFLVFVLIVRTLTSRHNVGIELDICSLWILDICTLTRDFSSGE